MLKAIKSIFVTTIVFFTTLALADAQDMLTCASAGVACGQAIQQPNIPNVILCGLSAAGCFFQHKGEKNNEDQDKKKKQDPKQDTEPPQKRKPGPAGKPEKIGPIW